MIHIKQLLDVKKTYQLALFIGLILSVETHAQTTVLKADGQTATYDLINSTLAAGNAAVEAPDCSHEDFGDHIDQIFDESLNDYAFRFHLHVSTDNDRCKNFDRQRNEIKTYSKSPDVLKAITGETVIYKWLFKLDDNFQASSSFSHLHQIKAVGGSEEGMPLITFTARKGNPDQLELRYAEALNQITLKKIDLDEIKGEWIAVEEKIIYGEEGQYKVQLSRNSDQKVVFEYEDQNIRMWKTEATFLRPKWGLYRSLNNAQDLRDEEILFANFSIEEVRDTPLSNRLINASNTNIYPNPSSGKIYIASDKKFSTVKIYDTQGKSIQQNLSIQQDSIDISALPNGLFFLILENQKCFELFKIVKE